MIIWTGWGILTPFLLGVGLFGASFATRSFYGPGFMETHSWVFGVGLGLGGFLCWLVGRWLYGRDNRVFVDKATGREVNAGGSHTLFLIPMHWIGVLAMLAAIPAAIYIMPPKSRSKDTTIASSASHYESVADAQQAAISRYPELGVADSAFNKAFLTLHKKYQSEHPELFRGNDWPLVIADEVDRTIKLQ
jgi:hypothetical protein